MSSDLDSEAQHEYPTSSNEPVETPCRPNVVKNDLALVAVEGRGSANNRKLHVPIVKDFPHLILEIHDRLDVALLDSPKFVVL